MCDYVLPLVGQTDFSIGCTRMPKFLRIGVLQSNVSGYTSKAWWVRRVGSTVLLKWGAVEVHGSETGERSTGRLHRRRKQFAAARSSAPGTMQKPPSRGDAATAMN